MSYDYIHYALKIAYYAIDQFHVRIQEYIKGLRMHVAINVLYPMEK